MPSLIYQTRELRDDKAKELELLDADIKRLADEADALVRGAEEAKRDLDTNETARFNELLADQREKNEEADALRAEVDELEERVASLQEHQANRERLTEAGNRWGERSEETEKPQRGAKVISEARTYTPDAERRGVSFYQDLYMRFRDNDPRATERLDRHQREARMNEAAGYERRDGTTANYAGLTVPQYLTDMVAPLTRAMRPTVDICNRHPLPADGLTVNISRITTGSTVGAQSDEGDGVSEQDVDDTLLTVNVRTYAGQQDLSRQALERGSGVDSIVTQDLVNAYWSTLDNAIVNGTGAASTHVGIRSTANIQTVAYADSTPTAAELYPHLAELISEVQSGVYMGVTHFIMHPRRWWWIASQVGSTFPLIQAPMAAPQQAGNVGGTEYAAQNRNILGVPVVLDGNIPTTLGTTNEDVILGVTAPELHLWHDDGPLFIRAEQPGAGDLEVKFVVYSYSAFTAGRYPGAHGVISSTGLTVPSF